jgi:hypothetical protein
VQVVQLQRACNWARLVKGSRLACAIFMQVLFSPLLGTNSLAGVCLQKFTPKKKRNQKKLDVLKSIGNQIPH